MPKLKDSTPWQQATLIDLAQRVGTGWTYNGANDDHYAFKKGSIYAYVKLLSSRAREPNPRCGIKIIVKADTWNRIREGLLDGNDWFGSPTRHLFLTEDDPSKFDEAVDLLVQASNRVDLTS